MSMSILKEAERISEHFLRQSQAHFEEASPVTQMVSICSHGEGGGTCLRGAEWWMHKDYLFSRPMRCMGWPNHTRLQFFGSKRDMHVKSS